MFKKFQFVAVMTLLVGLTAASSVYAQSVSGRGVDNRAMGQVSCLAEVERQQLIVQNLTAKRDAMLDCNAKGMVFGGVGEPGADADGCFDLEPLVAKWVDSGPADPGKLKFSDNDGPVGSDITVIQGRDGKDAECPDGYDPI